jgi:hypothetical protein
MQRRVMRSEQNSECVIVSWVQLVSIDVAKASIDEAYGPGSQSNHRGIGLSGEGAILENSQE